MRITRTVIGTRATVITVNTKTLNAEKKIFSIGKEYDNNDKLLKALKKAYDNEEQVLSTVLTSEKFEELYGLDESIFMKYAVRLDAKTRKPIETTAEPQAETTAESQAETTAEPQAESQAEPQDGMTITAPVTVTEVSAKATKIKK